MKKMKFKEPKTWREGFGMLAVMFEAMHGDIRAIAEQQGGMKSNISKIKETQSNHTEMIGDLKVEVTGLRGDVDEIKEDVSLLKEDVSVLKEDVGELKEDMKDVKENLKQKVDKDDFVQFKARILVPGR